MKRVKYIIVLFLLLGMRGVNAQTYEELIEKSYAYLEKDDLLAAEMSLREAMRQEPGNPNNYALLTNLGTILRREGKKEEAIFSYTAALSRHPKSTVILDNRASLYLEMGETEKALNDYNMLLLEDPINQEALYARGMIFLQQKNFLWAEQDFDKMLEVNEASLYARMGHAILEKMRGNYDESERIYNYLIDKLPREWQLYRSRADLYFMAGKNSRAMTDVNRLFIETEPDAELYVLRGKVKLAQYERDSASKDFQKAKELGYDSQIIEELLRMTK